MTKRVTWEERWAGTNFGRVYRTDNTDGDERVQRALDSRYHGPRLVTERRITSATGWLSPAGAWHPCCEEGHGDTAQLILDASEPGKWTGPDREHWGGYERELERRGYVKLGSDMALVADGDRVTPRQKRMLVDWLLSDDNDHTAWPLWLEPEQLP
jgi:hypothetical protein